MTVRWPIPATGPSLVSGEEISAGAICGGRVFLRPNIRSGSKLLLQTPHHTAIDDGVRGAGGEVPAVEGGVAAEGMELFRIDFPSVLRIDERDVRDSTGRE